MGYNPLKMPNISCLQISLSVLYLSFDVSYINFYCCIAIINSEDQKDNENIEAKTMQNFE